MLVTTYQSIPFHKSDYHNTNVHNINLKYWKHWPSDRNKLPDLVDVCVTKGNPQTFSVAKACFSLSSNHSLVLITLKAHTLNQEKQPSLSNRHTNWDDFRQLINERLTLNVSLKTEDDIEAAVKFFNNTIQWAGRNRTYGHTQTIRLPYIN
jgi:hypothetical protein